MLGTTDKEGKSDTIQNVQNYFDCTLPYSGISPG